MSIRRDIPQSDFDNFRKSDEWRNILKEHRIFIKITKGVEASLNFVLRSYGPNSTFTEGKSLLEYALVDLGLEKLGKQILTHPDFNRVSIYKLPKIARSKYNHIINNTKTITRSVSMPSFVNLCAPSPGMVSTR